ncbi:MAG: CYTH domain-containing protein [Chitinivibrionales bacterium]
MDSSGKDNFEVERQFFVSFIPEGLLKYNPCYKLKQGYLAIEDKREVRIRAKQENFSLTVKTGDGIKRTEREIELTPDDFTWLWPLTKGRRIVKTRYNIPFEQYTIELDIYEENLSGFVSAEVEFPSESESNEFIPPEWFGKEVTWDSRFKNKNIVLKGIPEDIDGLR